MRSLTGAVVSRREIFHVGEKVVGHVKARRTASMSCLTPTAEPSSIATTTSSFGHTNVLQDLCSTAKNVLMAETTYATLGLAFQIVLPKLMATTPWKNLNAKPSFTVEEGAR